MAEPRDYYETLGVAGDADEKAIKDAFRQLALKYHPDRNKAPDATDRFREIAKAYAVLSDPEKRAEYDARGRAGVAGFSAEDLFGGIDFGDIFGGLGFEFGTPGPFERMFRRRCTPARGENTSRSPLQSRSSDRRRRRSPRREHRRAFARRSTERRRSRRRAAGHDPQPRREGIAELRRRPSRRPLHPASDSCA